MYAIRSYYADKLAARKVVILGGDELARGVAMLRDMSDGSQREVALGDLHGELG